jgi:hypothetical protein
VNKATFHLCSQADSSIYFICSFDSAIPAANMHCARRHKMQSSRFSIGSFSSEFQRRLLRHTLSITLLVLFLAAVCAAPGSEFWEKNDYQQWSQKECSKMLEDSPWSKTLALSKVGIMDKTGLSSSSSQQPYIKYQFQLRCAAPVRLAMVRQMQFAQKYDSFSPELRQEFDKKAESFLKMDFSNAVIVYVTYSTNSQPNALELNNYWQSKTTELLKNSVYLRGSQSEKTPLIRFVPPPSGQQEFQFIFPRQISGKPTIGPQDKFIRLEFEYPVVDGMGDGNGYMEFKTEKMVFAGNLAY